MFSYSPFTIHFLSHFNFKKTKTKTRYVCVDFTTEKLCHLSCHYYSVATGPVQLSEVCFHYLKGVSGWETCHSSWQRVSQKPGRKCHFKKCWQNTQTRKKSSRMAEITPNDSIGLAIGQSWEGRTKTTRPMRISQLDVNLMVVVSFIASHSFRFFLEWLTTVAIGCLSNPSCYYFLVFAWALYCSFAKTRW